MMTIMNYKSAVTETQTPKLPDTTTDSRVVLFFRNTNTIRSRSFSVSEQ